MMNMNEREKLLAGGVGIVLGALVLWYAWSSVMGWIDDKNRQIETLTDDVAKKNEEMLKARLASKRLAEYEARSLPRDADLASTQYHAWLLKVAEQAGLTDVSLDARRPSAAKNTYRRIGFGVSAKGTLPQLVDFLHRFEEMDWLHRIDSMSLTPQKNSKNLDLSFDVSALSVNSAPNSDSLVPRVSEHWKTAAIADYRDPILNRNVFGAPNREPKLDAPSKTTAYMGRTFEYTFKATDPDPLDRITYELVANADPPAKLDPKSGKLTWTPRSKQDFTFEVVARDDGLPSKTKPARLLVNVTDPPAPKPPEGPRKLAFDDAKYTYLTAVLNDDGDPEIWLHNRPRGEIRRLHIGDRFEIGSIKGEVSAIGLKEATLLVDGKPRQLEKGDPLLATPEVSD